MSSVLRGLPPASRPPAPLPPIRYAAAAAAAVAPQTPSTVPPLPTPVAPSSSTTLPHVPPTTPSILTSQSTSQDPVQSSPSLTHPSVTSPVLSSSASVSQQPDGSLYSGVDSPAMSEAVPSSHGGVVVESPESRKGMFECKLSLSHYLTACNRLNIITSQGGSSIPCCISVSLLPRPHV
jgi:CCR4-NOT transcription complex subunit 3